MKAATGKWHRVLPVAALAVVLSTAGCASTPSQHATAGATSPTYRSAKYTGALTTRIDLAGTGISLGPPVDQTPASQISGAQAFQTCTTGDSLCDPAISPNVYLALADKPDSNMVKRPVWVIDYPNSTCTPYGHPPIQSTSSAPAPAPASASPTAAAAYSCRLVNLVDSLTGMVLWSVRVPQ